MPDDDIQYLGSCIKSRDPPRSMQRIVNGIVLYIEKSDENEPYFLKFGRDESPSILVGRRPGVESEYPTLDHDNDRAMFRCAVVSRRHAKIVFTNSGNVFIIDLNSHHGTHIRKPGEASSRMLETKVPIPLSDGDIITFGKTVGRNEGMVRPIVVRVQLLYSGPCISIIEPSVVPESSVNRSRSGRCSPYSPSSSSSDEAYNDVPQAESQSKAESHLGKAFEALKLFMPSSPIPSAQFQRYGPRLDEQSSIQFESSSVTSPSDLPPLWSLPTSRLPVLPRYSPVSSADLPNKFIDLPSSNPVNANQVINFSRSESPMDLASPSPPLPGQVTLAVGAWPDISSTSPKSDPMLTPPDNDADRAAEIPAAAVNTTVQHEDNHEAVSFARNQDPLSSSFAAIDQVKQKEQNPTVDSSLFVTRIEFEELQARYTKIQAEIDILQAQYRKYKSRFNANVHAVTENFHALEDKMSDMAARCTIFMDHMEGTTSADISDIQTRIDDLLDASDIHQTSIDELRRKFDFWEMNEEDETPFWAAASVQEEKEGAQKYLDIQKNSAESETLRHQLREIIQREGAPSTSTKRKRHLDDEGGCYSNTSISHPEEELAPVGSSGVTLCSFVHPHSSHDQPSPRKRARKIAAVAAQTATALTMGAVFTWVALAFS